MTSGETRLRAGIAGVSLTPEWPVHMECQPAREPLADVLDPVEARAIVFDDGARRVALVAADLTGVETETVRRVQEATAARTAIPAHHVLLMASHTHSAPATTRFKDVPLDPAYLRWLEEQLAAAIAAAANRLQPVCVGAGEGRMDFNVNRRQRTSRGMVLGPSPTGLVDRRVRVLRVEPTPAGGGRLVPGSLGGRRLPQCGPLAVLFAYSCHPTVKGVETYLFNGDYPGVARGFIERAYAATLRGAPAAETAALFLPGCFGNLRPYLLRDDGRWREGTDDELLALGRLLGSEVVQVTERIAVEPVNELAFARQVVRLSYSHVPDAAELRAHAAQGGRHAWWARNLLRRLEERGNLPDGEMLEVSVLRLGRHWLVYTPGETFLEIGLAIERGLSELGLAKPERGDLTMALSYTNGYVGYLCTATAMLEGGYEPGAWPDYQRPGPFSLDVEPTVVNAALGLAQQLGPSPTP